ncbi:RNA polymerase sigma factor [Ktedonobacteria bacterium brp13]|nr:RNA polymerase sigma factor [Ktedonobacteria bacterium brp13]
MNISNLPEAEELDLVKRFRGGDLEAFRPLVTYYEPRLFAFLLQMLGNRENTLDILQETFLTVFQELPGWRSGFTGTTGHPLAPWIYRIATNKALTFLRKHSVRERYSDWQTHRTRERNIEREPAFPAQEHLSMEERYITRELLRMALLKLKTDEAICLIAHFIDGERYRETAERLGLSNEAVRKRTQRALIALRKASKELGLEVS